MKGGQNHMNLECEIQFKATQVLFIYFILVIATQDFNEMAYENLLTGTKNINQLRFLNSKKLIYYQCNEVDKYFS